MSPEENKELVRRWTEEGFGKGDLDLVDVLFDPDYVNHSPLAGQAADRMTDNWGVVDMMGMMQQLGTMPASEGA